MILDNKNGINIFHNIETNVSLLRKLKRYNPESRKLLKEASRDFFTPNFIRALKNIPEEEMKKILEVNPELLNILI